MNILFLIMFSSPKTRAYLGPVALIILSCDVFFPPDTVPPTVTIISPPDSSVVFELVEIQCEARDNEEIDQVELLFVGDTLIMRDESEPYTFYWSTAGYDDGSTHHLVAAVNDASGNMGFSDTLILVVDNSTSYPAAVVLQPVIFEEDQFEVTWNSNQDSCFFSGQGIRHLAERCV